MKNFVVRTNDELGRMYEETGPAYFKGQSQLLFGGTYENKKNLSLGSKSCVWSSAGMLCIWNRSANNCPELLSKIQLANFLEQ
jgi:hypothetical protein